MTLMNLSRQLGIYLADTMGDDDRSALDGLVVLGDEIHSVFVRN